jgi:acetoin utilization deacetylase AcuC-like enzyme
VFYDDHLTIPLPDLHRFPIEKYAMTRAALVARGLVRDEDLVASTPATLDDLRIAHDEHYARAVLAGELDRKAVRALGFSWSEGLVAWAKAGVGGTLGAVRAALTAGVAGNLGGGTHHAMSASAGGFCLFNDLAIASLACLDAGLVSRVLVLDLDVHQGDGTAEILAREPRAFTCSMHSAKNYPFEKKASDLDVGLPDGADDDAFLCALDATLAEAIERSRPELILYQAGVDTLREDRMGRLAMTRAGVYERDLRVLECASRLGVPIVLTMGGGYASPIDISVEAHLGTYAAARAAFKIA